MTLNLKAQFVKGIKVDTELLYTICYHITTTTIVFQPTEAGPKEQLDRRHTTAAVAYSWSRPGLFSGRL